MTQEARMSTEKRPSFRDQVAEFVKVFIIAVAFILPVRLFLIQPFYVHGQSMEPNFENSDYLIIDKLSLRFSKIERGEVIVFLHRNPRVGTQPRYLIKRVIGLPGERIRIGQGVITVFNEKNPQGIFLKEDQYHPRSLDGLFDDSQLARDEYYVLGDNRPVSEDSENFGPIKTSQIVGKVWIRGFPFDRVGIFETPLYPQQ